MNTRPLLIALAALMAAGVVAAAALPQEQKTDPQLVDDFQKRVQAVVELRNKLARETPPLGDKATPEEIDHTQRALEAALRSARSGAQRGDLFTPPVEAYIRKSIADLLARPEGKLIRASIMDENPSTIAIQVNDRYPDELPLSTMPPQLLEMLPAIPEELEYRFVGPHLVILDPHAHIVIDVVPKALPE